MRSGKSLANAILLVSFLLFHGAKSEGIRASTIGSPKDDDAQVTRQLNGYLDAYWPRYNGKACRTGSGDDGEHRDEYYHYEDKSLSWCKEKCYTTDECKAFEYKVEGDYRKCEIWFQKPERFLSKEGYRCWIKRDDVSDNEGGDSVEDDNGGDSITYTMKEDQACRTSDGEKGSHGKEYRKFTQKTFEWCIERCNTQLDCKAFEYNSNGTPHCEIWIEEPTKSKRVNGSSCYVKNNP
ncbi:MAG: hypothetical protein SGILL_002980 [Bacillariaceae sp.]